MSLMKMIKGSPTNNYVIFHMLLLSFRTFLKYVFSSLRHKRQQRYLLLSQMYDVFSYTKAGAALQDCLPTPPYRPPLQWRRQLSPFGRGARRAGWVLHWVKI